MTAILLGVLAMVPPPGARPIPKEPEPEAYVPALPQDVPGLTENGGEIRWGSTFRGALLESGIAGEVADSIQRHLHDAEFDFTDCRPGQCFTAQTDSAGKLAAFRYGVDKLNSYWILPDSAGILKGFKYTIPTTRELVSIEGKVETSVYHSLLAYGEKPELVVAYEEVLGYDMDFIFDPRKGDTFSMLVERIMLGDEIIGYGKLLCAAYEGEITGEVVGYWFDDTDTKSKGWFAPNGENLQKAFKRAPLPILKVTSGYGMRRHPISGKVKMHTGIDYGAPTGTPVWAVGAGTVSYAGWRGGYGKTVEIRHSGSVKTRYAHLSAIAVKRGQAVRQHQTIGKVGSTGYATGPHLHFEFLVNGKFTMPRRVKNPPLKRIPKDAMPRFEQAMHRIDSTWSAVKGAAYSPLAANE